MIGSQNNRMFIFIILLGGIGEIFVMEKYFKKVKFTFKKEITFYFNSNNYKEVYISSRNIVQGVIEMKFVIFFLTLIIITIRITKIYFYFHQLN